MESNQLTVYEVARYVASLWKIRPTVDTRDGIISVLVENASDRWRIDVPRVVTEAACVAIEARSRVWEAVLYAATGSPQESLAAAAAAYGVIQRSSVATAQLRMSRLSENVCRALQIHLLAGMTDELFYAEHLASITQPAGDDTQSARLQARYADAVARTALAVDLEKAILEQAGPGEVDVRFIEKCRTLFI